MVGEDAVSTRDLLEVAREGYVHGEPGVFEAIPRGVSIFSCGGSVSDVSVWVRPWR